MSKKIIIGLTGLIASGKGTAASYFVKKHKAQAFKFSDILRDLLDRLYLPQTRDNLQDISIILRRHFGEDLLANAIAQDIKKSAKKLIVIDGIRRLADIKNLKKIKGFKLVAIRTDERLRYQRLTNRRENTDDKKKSWAEFKKEGRAETERQIAGVMRQANIVVDNNGSLKAFYRQLDRLVK